MFDDFNTAQLYTLCSASSSFKIAGSQRWAPSVHNRMGHKASTAVLYLTLSWADHGIMSDLIMLDPSPWRSSANCTVHWRSHEVITNDSTEGGGCYAGLTLDQLHHFTRLFITLLDTQIWIPSQEKDFIPLTASFGGMKLHLKK